MGGLTSKQTSIPSPSEAAETDYMKTLAGQLRQKCYNEKKVDACHQLAIFLEQYQNQHEESKEIMQSNCHKHHWGESCYHLAQQSMYGIGDGTRRDSARGLEYYNRGCDYKHGTSCTMAAMFHCTGLDGVSPIDLKKATDFFQRGCDLEEKASCLQVGLFKRYGPKDFPIDRKGALEMFEKACTLGSFVGCREGGSMYENGVGVEQDMGMAADFYARAKRLRLSDIEDS